MPSKFRICIIRQDGEPVYLLPGSHGERDLVASIVDATLAKGVGFFRTSSHVKQDLTDALNEVILNLKAEVRAT